MSSLKAESSYTPSKDEIDTGLPPAILSVFWCGTDGNKNLLTTHVQLFGQWCEAVDISDLKGPLTLPDDENPPLHYKLRLDGCGVAFGMMGVIFGAGLSEQASLIRDRVSELSTLHRRKVVLNLFGLSRGAVGCFIAAKKFKKFDPNFFEIHMLAFDPVPGNFVTTAKFDLLGLTNAWGNMDLKSIAVVKTALLLYPCEPLPDTAVHAPMIPLFAPGIATYDVILGCHQGAMWGFGPGLQPLDVRISATIIKNFLASHGTILNRTSVDRFFFSDDQKLLENIEAENRETTLSKRSTHSYGSIMILREQDAPYLNKLHAILRDQSQKGTIGEHWTTKPFFYLTPLPEDLQTNLKFSNGL
jgi:hypothetical protein